MVTVGVENGAITLLVVCGRWRVTMKPHSTGFESTWHTCWLIEN